MLQLFESHAISFADPRPIRSALGALTFQAFVVLFLLSLGFSPMAQKLPMRLTHIMLTVPPPPPPPPPPLTEAKLARVAVRRTPVRAFTAALTAPTTVPHNNPVKDIVIDAPPEVSVIGGVPGGIPGGVLGGVFGGVPAITAPPPPPPPVQAATRAPERIATPAAPERITVSAEVQEAQLLVMVHPEYPAMAKSARIQGAVHLTAVIDGAGNITELKAVSGPALLVPAALAAVQKWHYRPTVFNGHTVEVATEIIVKFKLSS